MKPLVTGSYISASAGTGKTYQLTSRFLALLFLGAPVSSLIAVTFTRKAAGEFRRRIFQALAEGTSYEMKTHAAGERNPVTARIWETWTHQEAPLYPSAIPFAIQAEKQGCFPENLPNLPAELRLDRDCYCRRLRELVTAGSRLHLSTLDSFFNMLLGTQCLALGVSEISPMEDADLQQAEKDALFATVSHLGAEKMRDILHNLRCNGSRILSALSALVRNYNELLQDAGTAANNYAQAFSLPDYTEKKELDQAIYRRDLLNLAKEFEEMGGDSLKVCRGRKKASTAIKALLEDKFSTLAYEDENWNDTPEAVKLREVLRELTDRKKTEILRDIQVKTRDLVSFLSSYTEIYQQTICESGRYSFADITRLASILLGGPHAPTRLAYLLDGQLDHWMLDEFQDTSPKQWETLLGPLTEVAQCESAVAEDPRGTTKRSLRVAERSLFVVGDLKQSIYGFRGASPQLFSDLAEKSPWKEVMLPRTLTNSRRSSPLIMRFVNLLFNAMEMDEEEKERYTDHSSDVSKQGLPGYVEFSEVSKENYVRDSILPILQKLTVNGHPLPGRSIAIITRNNDESEEIADILFREQPNLMIQVIKDIKSAVFSPLGQLLLTFFQWLLHPGIAHWAALLNFSVLKGVLRVGKTNDATGARLHWLQMINATGYAKTLRELLTYLPREETPEDFRTVLEWENAAMEFDKKGGSIRDWITFISELAHCAPGAPGFIHILTMHKSKGMEFDAVILPLTGIKSVDDTSKMNYYTNSKNEGFLLTLNRSDRSAWEAQLEPSVNEWKRKQLSEEQRLLYVAITRARYALYILLNEKARNNSLSGIIRNAEKGAGEEMQKLLKEGDFEWYLHLPNNKESGEKGKKEDKEQEKKQLGMPSASRRVVRPSQLEPQGRVASNAQTSDGEAPSTEQLMKSGREAAAFGTAVHALWEQIGWLSSPQDFPTWVHSPQGDEQQVVARALQRDDVRAILSCPAGERWQLYREQPFVFAVQGKAELVSGTFDRVQVRTDATGKPQEALIIDYKTDRVSNGDEAEYAALRARHAPQMRAYRRYLAEWLHLEEAAVRVALISVPRSGGDASVQLYSATELV